MKKLISVAEATRNLQREFEKVRPPGCRTCRFPTPFWGPAVSMGTGYWYLNVPAPCPANCHVLINRMWSTFMTDHEIEHLPYNSRAHREQRAILAKNQRPRVARWGRGLLLKVK